MSTDFPLTCAMATMNRSKFDHGRLNDALAFVEVLNEYAKFKANQRGYHDSAYAVTMLYSQLFHPYLSHV